MNKKSDELLHFGGQAVIEGVMMKSPNYISIAVRKPDKKISIKTDKYKSLAKRCSLFKIPFIRGVGSLFEMLTIGIKALTYSANQALEEEEEKLSGFALFLTILLSMVFGIGLFVVVPYILTVLLGIQEESQSILFNLVDGIIKMAIFVLYIYVISLMKDIHRIFQYHGAEHKAVNCHEAGEKLTIKNAKKFSRLHPRCGTSFLLLVIFIGIIIFSLIPLVLEIILPSFSQIGWWSQRGILLFSRLLFLLPVAGISYEVLKLAGAYRDSLIMKTIVFPGLCIQRLTTKEPTNKQLEVGITSLKAAMKAEKIDNC
jgi:uncharacterized protein YqhQ